MAPPNPWPRGSFATKPACGNGKSKRVDRGSGFWAVTSHDGRVPTSAGRILVQPEEAHVKMGREKSLRAGQTVFFFWLILRAVRTGGPF